MNTLLKLIAATIFYPYGIIYAITAKYDKHYTFIIVVVCLPFVPLLSTYGVYLALKTHQGKD